MDHQEVRQLVFDVRGKGERRMKTLMRLVFVAVLLLAIYFATIGRSDFYRLLDDVSDVIQAIGNNYTKK